MKIPRYLCVKDNEHGDQSNLVGKRTTLGAWREWALNDRKELGDEANYQWLKEATDSEFLERIQWLYNIELKLVYGY